MQDTVALGVRHMDHLQESNPVMTEWAGFVMKWYEKWFEETYLSLYAHRNDDEAKSQVGFICDRYSYFLMDLSASPRVLDVACGWGRHLRHFQNRGLQVVGVDLSTILLGKARAADDSFALIRADMRSLPFCDRSFQLICNFFTSFGYFETDCEHQALLVEWRRLLTSKGMLVIDYMNKPFILETLVSESSEMRDDHRIVQRRTYINGRVNKTIEIQNDSGAPTKIFNESVRLYSAYELSNMLCCSGFATVEFFSADNFGPLRNSAPGMLVVAKSDKN